MEPAEGVANLYAVCTCNHVRASHAGIDVVDYHRGHCAECDCRKFVQEGQMFRGLLVALGISLLVAAIAVVIAIAATGGKP